MMKKKIKLRDKQQNNKPNMCLWSGLKQVIEASNLPPENNTKVCTPITVLGNDPGRFLRLNWRRKPTKICQPWWGETWHRERRRLCDFITSLEVHNYSIICLDWTSNPCCKLRKTFIFMWGYKKGLISGFTRKRGSSDRTRESVNK